MRYTKWLMHFMLLLAIPALIASPPAEIFNIPFQPPSSSYAEKMAQEPFSYDEILGLIEKLETGELEKKCSSVELEKFSYFIALLAQQGMIPNAINENSILAYDIQELLDGESNPYEYASFFYQEGENSIAPDSFYGEREIIFCKGGSKSKWKNLKKFIKKHKKAIIIGAAIIVAATIVVYVVAASTAASAAAAAGVGTAISSELKPEESFISPPETPLLKEAFDDYLAVFQEIVIEEEFLGSDYVMASKSCAFVEKTREMGAVLAHQALEGVAELASILPQLGGEIKDMGAKFLSASPLISDIMSDTAFDPQENYERLIALGHETIDRLFVTDQAYQYTPEYKANSFINDFTVGALPPPGMIFKVFSSAGRIMDRGGLTKAGRALMKHGYREGSAYPKPRGTPAQINEHGQKILESILNHPEKIIYEYQHPAFGEIIDIEIPGGRGVRFTVNGEMVGFLEPRIIK